MTHRSLSQHGVVLLVSSFLAISAQLVFASQPAHAETAGDLFVVDVDCCGSDRGGVIRVSPTNGTQTVISSGQNFVDPVGIVLAVDGMLYVVDQRCTCGAVNAQGGVIRVNPTTGAQTVVSGGQNYNLPSGIALAADGMLYVVDQRCTCGAVNAQGGIIKVNPSGPATNNQTVVSSGQNFDDPVGIALAADGMLYVVDFNCLCGTGGLDGGIINVNPGQPVTSNQTVVSGGQNFEFPVGIALAADGMLYVVDQACDCGVAGAQGGIIKVNPGQPATSNQTVVSVGQNFITPLGIALAADGSFYVADLSCGCGVAGVQGGIIKVNPSQANSSNQSAISAGVNFVSPANLAVVPQVSLVRGLSEESTGTNLPINASVTRAPWSALPLTVPFTTTDNTATGGADFTPTSGSVTIPGGSTQITVPISVVGDNLAEGEERFTLAIQPPNGVGVVGSASGPARILDDDGTASLSVAGVTVLEPASGFSRSATFTVTLDRPSGPTVTVQYATAGAGANPAASPGDLAATSGTVTFLSGETSKTVDVTVNGDGLAEPTETFALCLSVPTGGAAIGTACGNTTILDYTNNCVAPSRPRVIVSPSAGGGKLNVTVASSQLNTGPANPLQQIRFGQSTPTNPPRGLQNARVIMNGQTMTNGQTVVLPADASSTSFTVERVTAGQSATAHFAVTDQCGEWRTFVGGGTGAGF